MILIVVILIGIENKWFGLTFLYIYKTRPQHMQAMKRRAFFTQDEIAVYSEDQMDAFLFLKEKHTWNETIRAFSLTGPQVLSTLIINTATGYNWCKGAKGGRKSIISTVDAIELVKQLHERADQADCVPTYEAITIAEGLISYRKIRAEYLLNSINAGRLFERLKDDTVFELEQLKFIIEKNGMTLANKQNLADLRKQFCTYAELDAWYDFVEPFLHGIPYMTFNADETIVASHSDGKVVTIKKRLPLVKNVTYNSHITAMCCHSASGVKVPLFIILQNLQNIPQELKAIPNVYFASSASGWITHTLFTAWCIHFCTWLSKYRSDFLAEHYPQDHDKPVILFIDGHGSRINYEALNILRMHNVIAITFRSHTTHLCQPFDVVIASPLKTYLRQFWLSAEKRYEHVLPQDLVGTKRLRFLLIYALLDATQAAFSHANCSASFAKTGLLPFNKDIVLKNENYIFQRPDPGQLPPQRNQPQPQLFAPQQYPGLQNPRLLQAIAAGHPHTPLAYENVPLKVNGRIYIGEKILTSDKVLLDLYCILNNPIIKPNIPPNVNYMMEKVKVTNTTLKNGKMLSHFALYYVRVPTGGVIQIPQ